MSSFHDRQEDQREAAISICIAAGVLKRCDLHPETVFETGQLDVSYAYRVGNAKFAAGEFNGVFDSPREMTDAVKAAIDEHGLDYCSDCHRVLAD